MDETLATPQEVANYLGLTVDTLTRWRYQKTGPCYLHVGRHVRYDWDDVREWCEDQKVGAGHTS